jgi:DNA-binding Lrp family transcriptional regulator
MIQNCRITYRDLAENLNLTANAVKKRVTKLVDAGVLIFDVVPSYAQVDADPVLVMVKTDNTMTSDALLDELGEHELIFVVNPLPDGQLFYFADCRDSLELVDLLSFTRTRESVTETIAYSLITQRGKKGTYTNDQLRVLRVVLDDPRMSVSTIAQECGISARRVRRAINEMIENETASFMSRWNPNLGDSIAVCSEIRWKAGYSEMIDADSWLRETFPNTYWFSYIVANEPIFFAMFLLEHVREMEDIDKKLEESKRTEYANIHFVFPSRLYPRPRKIWLEELLDSKGF